LVSPLLSQTRRRRPAEPTRGTGRRRTPLARHRSLFNGDCNVYFYNPELWQPEGPPYSRRAIERFVDRLAEGGIDTFLINPNTQVVWYPSRKLETALARYRRGDREFLRPHAVGLGLAGPLLDRYFEEMERLLGLILDLEEGGIDWLAETATACRRRGIAPWVSFRMNDTHGAGNPESPFNCSLYRDPRNRLSGRVPGAGRREPSWVGLDYGRAEVRRYMLELIREPLEAYDFDGVELDWLRHPVCCEPVASGRQLEMMTAWIGDIRRLADARARRTGRPCPLGLRLPGSLGYMKSIGIDVAALARQGVIDFLGFSNFWQTSWDMPYDHLRETLGPEVAIFGVLEDAPNWLETAAPGVEGRSWYQELQLHGDDAYGRGGSGNDAAPGRSRGPRYLSASTELLRGNAAGKLALGVDGIEQFNFYVTDQVRVPGQRARYDALRGLAELESLRGKPKHYTLGTPSGRATAFWDIPEQLPARVAPGERRAFRLAMCAEAASTPVALVVQVVAARSASAAPLGVSLNGCWPVFERRESDRLLFPAGPYTHHVPEHRAFDYSVERAALREGWNEVVLVHGGEPAEAVEVVALEVAVKPRAGS
jgi:hypothetical protein